LIDAGNVSDIFRTQLLLAAPAIIPEFVESKKIEERKYMHIPLLKSHLKDKDSDIIENAVLFSLDPPSSK